MTAKEKSLSNLYFVYAIVISFYLSLVSCRPMTTSTTPTPNVPVKTALEVVDVSSSALVTTFYELSQLSDIVIIGTVTSELGVINTARSPGDNSQPDHRFFTIATVYEVEVEEYLVGNGPSFIYFAQWEGSIYHGETPSPEEIEQERLSSENKLYKSLRSDVRYLMFLRSIEVWEDYKIDGLEKGELFVRTANPWLFDATDQLRVLVMDMSTGVENMYPPQSLAEIIEKMKNSEIILPTVSYPAPAESSLDQSEPATPSYPVP